MLASVLTIRKQLLIFCILYISGCGVPRCIHTLHVRLHTQWALGELGWHHLPRSRSHSCSGVHCCRVRGAVWLEGVAVWGVELDQLHHLDCPLLLQRLAATAERLEKLPASLGGCEKGLLYRFSVGFIVMDVCIHCEEAESIILQLYFMVSQR